MRGDRLSAYEQHELGLEAALGNELEHGMRSLADPGLQSALDAFVGGKGRGGSFD